MIAALKGENGCVRWMKWWAAGWVAVGCLGWAGPEFNRDIAPVVYQYCAPCHHERGAGPFALVTYAQVRSHARQIATVVRSGFMPPWLPEAGYGSFQDELRLSEAQKRLFEEWARTGMREGAGEAPAPPQFPDGWALGKPDLVLKAPKPFELPASGTDVFWNFVYRTGLKTLRYVRAVEIRPGKPKLIHHSNLLVDRAGTARRREESPGAGFPGMDVTLERTSFDFDSRFLFWKPGTIPREEAPGMAWKLDPGADLILNSHMQPSGKPEEVQPEVGLYFTLQKPAKEPMLVEMDCDGQLDIPAGDANFVVSDRFQLPEDVDVLGVYPHAHYLGHVLEGWAELPDGGKKWLIRIPNWDLNWQAVYKYRTPVFLPKGTWIAMRYSYDNSERNVRNPYHPPRRVTGGDRAVDEMAHLWLQVLPRGAGDGRLVMKEALLRHRLARNPQDFDSAMGLGAVLMARLDAPEAVPYLETAVRLRPGDAEAHNLLGGALERVAEGRAAEAEFEEALKLEPDYQNARLNLARVEAREGRFEAALADYRKILAADPGDEAATAGLARALEARGGQLEALGETVEAERLYKEWVEVAPKSAVAHDALGRTLEAMGEYGRAVREFEAAVRLEPGNAEYARHRAEAGRGR
jgi:tetratricopeptide (TPR) repeat protein